MVVYTHKDVRVKVDDKEICCDLVSINTSVNVSPVFTNISSVSSDIKSDKAAKGTVEVQYYHTGEDPLSHFITNRATPIPLNIGGLLISSGYLSSYSLVVEQFSIAKTKAKLQFYEEVGGSFSPSESAVIPSEIELIKSFNAEIEGGKNFSKDDLVSINYNYSSTLYPVYYVDSTDIKEVRYGARKIDATAMVLNDDMSLPFSGLKENFKINLKDKNKNTKSSFAVDGLLRSKKIMYSVGGIPRAEYAMGAAKLGALEGSEASISSFTPSNGAPSTVAADASHSSVTVVGNNFINVDRLLIGEFPCRISEINAEGTSLTFDISSDILSGYSAPITIVTEGAVASSSTSFSVTGGLTDMHGF